MSDTASTLSAQDIAWIQKATGLLPAMDAALDIEKQKRELLSTARENIDKNVGTIKVGEDFEVLLRAALEHAVAKTRLTRAREQAEQEVREARDRAVGR